MIYKNIEKIIGNITINSPIRKVYTNNKFYSSYEHDIDSLKKIEHDLDIIYEKFNNPLKVVIMGEVKAGKSTLINSIVGETISYVDVVEATAAIIEISHGFKDESIIERYDKVDIQGSYFEINELLMKNRDNEDFFDDIKVIKIKKNIENLCKVKIVDTPGLETITLANSERTNNYIQESDVVLWVLNCNHLGQADILERLEEVYDLGKPIICIANRIDEIDADKEEVIQYIEDEIGYMINSIIPMSARLAFEGVITNDDRKIEESGFKLLINTLNEININMENVQMESILKSFDAQIIKDLNIHKRFITYFSDINNDLKLRFVNLDNYKNSLNADIYNKIETWYDNEFLIKEIDEIINNSDKEITFNMYISEEYIQRSINKFIFSLRDYMENKWSKYANEEIVNHINAIEFKYSEIPIETDDEFGLITKRKDYNTDFILNEAAKGAVTGGKIGVALATFSAVLGPSAAQISLGGALSGVVPPLIVFGALFKAAKFLKLKEKDQTNKINLKEKLFSIKAEFKNKNYEKIIKLAEDMNEQTLIQVKNNISNVVINPFKEMNIDNFEELLNNLNLYVDNIDKLIQRYSRGWVLDTNVFIDNPYILDSFEKDEVIILSKQVLIELDNKKRDEVLRRSVQKALDSINQNNNIIFDDVGKHNLSKIYIQDSSPDNYILNTAVKYNYLDVTLLTSDKNLLAKCKAEGISCCSLSDFNRA